MQISHVFGHFIIVMCIFHLFETFKKVNDNWMKFLWTLYPNEGNKHRGTEIVPLTFSWYCISFCKPGIMPKMCFEFIWESILFIQLKFCAWLVKFPKNLKGQWLKAEEHLGEISNFFRAQFHKSLFLPDHPLVWNIILIKHLN